MAIYQDQHLATIDLQIEEKHLLKSPFYQTWSQGLLDKSCLQEYAKEYSHHVRAFPTYLSALHAHTEDAKTRKEILQNLVDEEAGSPNHPDLWTRFALALGVTQEELDNHTPCYEIEKLIHTFRTICKEGSVAEGLACLYAYESQVPSVSVSKIEGLKKYYGISDPKELSYFTVHIAADVEHAATERALLKQHLRPELAQKVHSAVNETLDGLLGFLSRLSDRYLLCN